MWPIVFQGHMSNWKITRLKKIIDFDPNWTFPDCNPSLNLLMALKWCTFKLNSPMATKGCIKLEVALKRCLMVFLGHPSNLKVTRLKKSSNLTQIRRFQTVTPVLIQQWLGNDAQNLK